jgi:hypothetical protein
LLSGACSTAISAAPPHFAAGGEALEHAQGDQQDRGPDPDLGVGGQDADQGGGGTHHDEGEDQHGFAAEAVPEDTGALLIERSVDVHDFTAEP